MELAASLSGWSTNQTVSVQSVVDQGLQIRMPAWQQTASARLISTQATLTADDRIESAIRSMSSAQSWNISDNLADGTSAAVSSLMGSLASMGELMRTGIALTETTPRTTDNGDGTATVITTMTHDPGVAKIMEQFGDHSAAPANDAGAWLASFLGKGGTSATDNISAFSELLPLQVAGHVRFALAGTLGGAYSHSNVLVDSVYPN